MTAIEFDVLLEQDDLIEFSLGHVHFEDDEGRSIVQKDFKMGGERWRVHLSDADPFPSDPHAHCIEGRAFYKGGKMHLGTGELYKNARATGFRYPKKRFLELCRQLGKKFPQLDLPLSS